MDIHARGRVLQLVTLVMVMLYAGTTSLSLRHRAWFCSQFLTSSCGSCSEGVKGALMASFHTSRLPHYIARGSLNDPVLIRRLGGR